MANWKFSVGNVVRRAPRTPIATPTAHAQYPLTRWGDGYADSPGGWTHDPTGAYSVDFDLNLLEEATDRADAPLGWADLPNLLAGTPGLPANPIETGTFASRTAFKIYRPVHQDVMVMPGEDVQISGGIHLPAASTATGVEVMVQDLATGQFWNVAATPDPAWDDSGLVASETVDDTWEDFEVTISANPERRGPSYYRVIVRPVAAAYDATTYVYLSSPALVPELDMIAFVGHSIPLTSTVEFEDADANGPWTLSSLRQPVYSFVSNTPVFYRSWTLTVTVPVGAAPFTLAPRIGEVWIGKVRDFVTCPLLGVVIEHDQPGMVTVEGARGRTATWTDSDMGRRVVRLRFRASESGYEQFRDELYQGSRGGADNVLLIGEEYEAGVTIFGKYEPGVSFVRSGPTRWSYESKVWEEPRWSSGSQIPAGV